MNLIELHILQSFPVSCLNRDDVGSPKSALFGGVRRARISSQALKRPIRLMFNTDHYKDAFHTKRTKLAHELMSKRMMEIDPDIDLDAAQKLCLEVMSKLVDKKGSEKAKEDKNGRLNMPALIWLAPKQIEDAACAALQGMKIKQEIETLIEKGEAKHALEHEGINLPEKKRAALAKQLGGSDKDIKKATEELLKLSDPLAKVAAAIANAGLADAPDIALFGRMVANDPSLNVEGAAMFSHALSTHKSDTEVDFYSAVDDRKEEQNLIDAEDSEAGAGMIGTLEFNSATYYRYIAINLDMLADAKHLGDLTPGERTDILRAFLKAAMLSVPGARKNSMNAGTLPHEVLGIRKTSGQPLQLINAFESPVKTNGKGFASASLEAMNEHLATIEKTWGPQGEKHHLTEEGLESFLNNLLQG